MCCVCVGPQSGINLLVIGRSPSHPKHRKNKKTKNLYKHAQRSCLLSASRSNSQTFPSYHISSSLCLPFLQTQTRENHHHIAFPSHHCHHHLQPERLTRHRHRHTTHANSQTPERNENRASRASRRRRSILLEARGCCCHHKHTRSLSVSLSPSLSLSLSSVLSASCESVSAGFCVVLCVVVFGARARVLFVPPRCLALKSLIVPLIHRPPRSGSCHRHHRCRRPSLLCRRRRSSCRTQTTQPLPPPPSLLNR